MVWVAYLRECCTCVGGVLAWVAFLCGKLASMISVGGVVTCKRGWQASVCSVCSVGRVGGVFVLIAC